MAIVCVFRQSEFRLYCRQTVHNPGWSPSEIVEWPKTGLETVCRSSKWNARFCNQFAHGAAFIGFRQINRLPSSRIGQPSVWPHGLSPARETRSPRDLSPHRIVPGGCTLLRRAKWPFMKPVWRGLFDIQPGEGQVVFLLVAHSLFMGISLIVFETAASALFLARFPAESVPYTFIGTAFVVPLS